MQTINSHSVAELYKGLAYAYPTSLIHKAQPIIYSRRQFQIVLLFFKNKKISHDIS